MPLSFLKGNCGLCETVFHKQMKIVLVRLGHGSINYPNNLPDHFIHLNIRYTVASFVFDASDYSFKFNFPMSPHVRLVSWSVG